MKKKLLALSMVATIFVTGMAFGAGGFTNIRVQMNSLKVYVNGKQVTSPNIVYNGTTYVPLRAVSEGLGQAVDFNASTKTVNIGEFKAEENPNVLDPKASQLKTPVSVAELEYSITFREDSIGTVYADVTYTNNSKYTLGSFQLKALKKDTNEKSYYGSYDTILPGETSPKFTGFGPKTKNESDLEILEIQYTLVDSSGKKTYVSYDTKLKIYKVY